MDEAARAIKAWTEAVWMVRLPGSTDMVGPVTLDQVQRGLSKGKLHPQVELVRQGSLSWRFAREVVTEMLATHGNLDDAAGGVPAPRASLPSLALDGPPAPPHSNPSAAWLAGGSPAGSPPPSPPPGGVTGDPAARQNLGGEAYAAGPPPPPPPNPSGVALASGPGAGPPPPPPPNPSGVALVSGPGAGPPPPPPGSGGGAYALGPSAGPAPPPPPPPAASGAYASPPGGGAPPPPPPPPPTASVPHASPSGGGAPPPPPPSFGSGGGAYATGSPVGVVSPAGGAPADPPPAAPAARGEVLPEPTTCPSCHAVAVIPAVELTATLAGAPPDPGADPGLVAWVCGRCGLAQLYAREPEQLWRAYLRRRENR